jgi:hypothetical protein
MATDTLKVSFDALDAQLRDVRRSIGLEVPDEPPAAPEPPVETAFIAAASATTGSRRRPPVWDLVFLGMAWAGLIALVAQAL